MLRKTIAILALFLLGLTMWYWSSTRENSLDELNDNLTALSQAVDAWDIAEAKALTAQAVNDYDAGKRQWSVFANHNVSQSIHQHLTSISVALEHDDLQTVRTQVALLKNYIHDYQEDNRLTLENIL